VLGCQLLGLRNRSSGSLGEGRCCEPPCGRPSCLRYNPYGVTIGKEGERLAKKI
jgi:hypothetical protein